MNQVTYQGIMMELSNIVGKEMVHIKSTLETPEIILNKKDGLLKFEGRSLPENPKLFYAPIKNWLSDYAQNPHQYTHVTFRFDYMNTTSSKMIMEVIDLLKLIERNNGRLIIDWYYQEDDDDMMEAGEDFAGITGAEFNFYSYP